MTAKQSCNDYSESIIALVMNEFDTETAASLNKHLEQCPNCRKLRDELAKEESMIQAGFNTLTSTADSLASQTVSRLNPTKVDGTSVTHSIKHRVFSMNRPYRFLTAATSIAAVIAILLILQNGTGKGIVFAQAIAPLRNLDSMSCRVQSKTTSPELQETQSCYAIIQNKQARVEYYYPDGSISYIRIINDNRFYDLNPSTKKVKHGKQESEPPWSALERIASLADEGADVELGEKTVGRLTLVGFQKNIVHDVTKVEFLFTVWVNAKSGLPHSVQIEFDQGDVKFDLIYEDMQWNETYDDFLFEIPEDYVPIVKPQYPETGDIINTRKLKAGVTFSIRRNQENEITNTNVRWIALQEKGNNTNLLIKLDNETWQRYRRTSPWTLDIAGLVRSNTVDQLYKDFKHELIIFEVTSIADQVEQLLTHSSETWVVTEQ